MRHMYQGPQRRRIVHPSKRRHQPAIDDAALRAAYIRKRLTSPGYYAEGYFWRNEQEFLQAVTGNNNLELED
jgi:hypothetical protein